MGHGAITSGCTSLLEWMGLSGQRGISSSRYQPEFFRLGDLDSLPACVRGDALCDPNRFEADVVINRLSQPLFAAEIALGRLDAFMPQQELNLLQFASRFMAKPRTRAAEIMRS